MVELLHEETKERLDGDNTCCSVLIIDEDRPGCIGFKERFLTVRRKDQAVHVLIQRQDGSDGNIRCILNTMNKGETMGQSKPARELIDFEPIHNRELVFEHGVTE